MGAKGFSAAFLALPLGELSSESETERASMLNFAHGLALSVTAAAVPPLPKGEARAFPPRSWLSP